MTCLTRCSEDVTYHRSEFPHGEYLLPLNSDGSIHRCPVLRSDEDDVFTQHNAIIADAETGQQYGELLYELQMIILPDIAEIYSQSDPEYLVITEFLKKLFLINHICPEPFTEGITNSYPLENGVASILGWIRLLYHHIGDENSSNEAKRLEKAINFSASIYYSKNNPQLEELSEKRSEISDEMPIKDLEEIIKNCAESTENRLKSNETDLEETKIDYNDNENYSVPKLLEYHTEIERELKSYLRKRISVEDIEKYFLSCYNRATKNLKNRVGLVKRSNNDIIEYLTFGDALKIIKKEHNIKKKDHHKMSEFEKNPRFDFKIDKIHLTHLEYVKDVRNDTSHITEKNDDILIDSNDRLIIYLAYLQLTEFFKTAKFS
jgi:hypothetical protein